MYAIRSYYALFLFLFLFLFPLILLLDFFNHFLISLNDESSDIPALLAVVD